MSGFAGTANDCLPALRQMVGQEHVRAALPADVVDGVMPRYVVEPASAAEVASVLTLANGAGLSVIPRGGGTKLEWGNPPRAAEVILSMRRLDRVIEHAAGDMTATVQAGCTVAEFGRALAERGQRLAVDPLWPARATIGGILAANDSGALRGTFGPLRDQLIGIQVVLADGTVARSGGKVVKNVAGYDLPKLFIGSGGTLGVITEATFRLYPMAHAERTLRFAASTESLGRIIAALVECMLVTTAIQIEAEDKAILAVQILVEGLPQALEGKVERLMKVMVDCGAKTLEISPDSWGSRESLFAGADACISKISVLPTQWSALIQGVRDLAAAHGLRWKLIAQAMGVGLLCLRPGACPKTAKVVPTPPSAANNHGSSKADEGVGTTFQAAPEQPSLTGGILKDLRQKVETMHGSLVILHCPAEMKRQIDVWPAPADALPLMRRIKAQFDPNAILSPGRFVGGI